MTSDLDVYRTANLLIKQHGSDTVLIASQKADELLSTGDHDGQRLWIRVIKAIREFEDTRKPQRLN